jgi:ATP-dependent RNA helicase DDX10/DBP4
MLSHLEQKRVPIERINVRAKKQQSIKDQLQGMCLKDPGLKYLGQKAFTSYVRSLHIQKDREVFKLDTYPLEEFAASLGLPGAPRIKFLKADAEEVKRRKNAPRMEMALSGSEDEGEDDDGEGGERRGNSKNVVRTKYNRMFERQNQDILAGHYRRMIQDDDKDNVDVNDLNGADDDLFDRKHRILADDPPTSADEESANGPTAKAHKAVQIPGLQDPLVLDSKRREKLLKSKKKLLKLKGHGSKLVFDDAGNAHKIYELEDEDDFNARGPANAQRRKFLEEEEERIRGADLGDKALAKEKKRAKREKRRERERAEAEEGGVEIEAGEDAMANFIADAGDLSEDEERQPVVKRQKKWFQKENSAPQGMEEREIETLDDLEAEAARLLG